VTISQVDSRLDSAAALLVEELIDKLQTGDVDVEAFIEAHPEHAERLRQLLPALRVMADLSNSPVDDQRCVEGDAAEMGTLGDFRIVREIGRGGMGVVYEAEQMSLGRRVALKVLPFAGTMDPRYLQRFHNEARAAASLHHEHIVPVYAVGCERAVHFYSMQFIEGKSLAELIAAQASASSGSQSPPASADTEAAAAAPTQVAPRDPAYVHRIAEWGIQAAEALEHAHSLGIVHRDVKPANLIVDERAKLWVTDFGLARTVTDAGLTMSGDLLGTLRYMSPEQAMGKRVVIDHRTDVYSLGATLYEVLTLQPAYSGNDRQELLRQIGFEEPRPLRKINKAIPAELETIVLKAMEKSPADRYATAQELADDLRNWLEDRPIRARRPSLQQMAAKWARRHKAVVWAVAAVLLMAIVLGGGTGLWWLQKRARAQGEAWAALGKASELQQQEKWPEARSAVHRARGVLAGVWVDEALRWQIEELDRDVEMALRLQEARLRGAAAGKRSAFDVAALAAAYEEAFAWYGLDVDHLDPQQAGEFIRSRSIALQLVAALDDWAFIGKRGSKGRRHLLAISRVADPDPWRDRLRDALEGKDPKELKELASAARADKLPPATVVLLARLAKGRAAVERVVEVLRHVQQRCPDDFWLNQELGNCLSWLGPARLEEALRYYTAAVALRPQSPGARLNLGTALHTKGQLDEAIAAYREAIRLEADYAGAHNNLGAALSEKGQLDEAIAAFREAIRLNKDAALVHYNLGIALRKKGRQDEAIAAFRDAIRLKKDYPEAHNNLGNALRDKGKLDEAIAAFRDAIRLKKAYPNAHYSLGNALQDKGQLDEAIAAFRDAIRLKKAYPNAHNNLGIALQDKGQLDEAIAAFRDAIRLKKEDAEIHYNLGNALRDKGKLDEAITAFREAIRLKKAYPAAHNNLGNVLHKQGKPAEAEPAYREAIALKPDFPEPHCNLGHALRDQGRFAEALTAYKRGHELGSRSPRWPYPSAQWVRTAEYLVALDARLPKFLSGAAHPASVAERLVLAQLCQRYKKRYAAAARFYAAAFTADPRLSGERPSDHRYNAACAAAMAGCGKGKDAADLPEKERAQLRRQSLDWLRADLDAWGKRLKKGPDMARPVIVKQMQHWLKDTDFAGVREWSGLGRLPAEECAAWTRLWSDVADLLARAKEPMPTDKEKPD
jgi:tetratricopeptide (TPR) repeat protein